MEVGAYAEVTSKRVYGQNPVGYAAVGVEYAASDRVTCAAQFIHHSSIPDFYDLNTTDMAGAGCRVYVR